MKTMLVILVSLFTMTTFAVEQEPLSYAEMSCDIYNTRLENGILKESQLLVSNKGNRFELGMAQWMKTELPAPYQGITVSFNHFSSYYNETGPETKTPYLQAYFEQNKKMIDPTRINFDIKNPVEGSKLLLRGTYKLSPESLLAYDCYLVFVK